jgi:hypothetical protein
VKGTQVKLGLAKSGTENLQRAGIIAPCIWVPTTSTLHLEVVDAACTSICQKNRVYRMLRLRVMAHVNGTFEVSGALVSPLDVGKLETACL